MVKAYLDSYNKITIYVSKDYYNGVFHSLFLLTDYGPVKLPDLVFVAGEAKQNIYEVNLEEQFINFDNKIYLINEYGYKMMLKHRFVAKDKRFQEDTYTDEYLGYKYHEEYTEFSIWAPLSSEVILVLNGEYHKMNKEKFVFRCVVNGDLDKCEYYYLVENNGQFNKVMDPYSYSYNIDQSASVVVNLEKTIASERVGVSKKSKFIYETSVRDISSLKKNKYKRKFLGLVEEEVLEHLDNMGMEYLQLMPIYSFVGDIYNSEYFYNWGYNPFMHGVPHQNYVYNAEDCYSIINECKLMINKIHEKGIKVVMDVVFNHFEERKENVLNLIVPYYFYLMRDGELSNGSYCGVDLDSTAPMMKRYIKDMCLRWVKFYGVDGFRFDLMGILDYKVMNEIYEDLKAINPELVIYGEGWNMPSFIDDSIKGTISNANKMSKIGFFNDFYREGLKYDYIGEDIINGNYIADGKRVFGSEQSINYLECHDNHPYYDLQTYVELRDESFSRKRQLFKNLIILMCKGYAFFHSGQEFFRTKLGVENSYRSSDEINGFDWNRLYKYSKEVNLIQKMVRIREKYNLFASDYMYKNEDNVIELKTNHIRIIINVSDKVVKIEDKEIMLATNKDKLGKYDLVIYKN